MRKPYFLGLSFILAVSFILSGCGKTYSDDDTIRKVQQYKYTIGNEKVEMLDVVAKVFEDAKWEKEDGDDGRVFARGAAEINKEKVMCELEFLAHDSWWEFTLRMNGMEQKDDLAGEYIKKKYKGENIERIEEQLQIPPNREECARFFKELLAYRCQGVDFDENKYSKSLRAYKTSCDLQKISAKGDGAEAKEADFLRLARTISRNEDVVEVSQIDRTNVRVTMRTKAIDHAELETRYEKTMIKTLDEFSGSLEASHTIKEAAEKYYRKRQADLDRESKEFLLNYQAKNGSLEGCAPGRVEFTKKANDDYVKIIAEMPHKIFQEFMRTNDLKTDGKEIVINIDWKKEHPFDGIAVDSHTVYGEGIDAVLDRAMFTNLREEGGGRFSSMDLFYAFYNTAKYKGELRVPGLEVMNQSF